MGVHEIDAEALQPFQALPSALVTGQGGADLGVVQRHGAQENAGAVQVEVTAADPELAESEALRQAGVEEPAVLVKQRNGRLVNVLRRVQVPKPFGHPVFGEGEAAALQLARRERLAELADGAAALGDRGAERVARLWGEIFQQSAEGDPPLAHRSVDLDFGDPGARRNTGKVYVAAQSAPSDLAGDPPSGVRVVEHEHDFLERRGGHSQSQKVLASRPADRREVDLAGGKPRFAAFLAVEEDVGAGVEIFQAEHDAAARPITGDADFSLIPGRGDCAEVQILPARMGEDRLAVVLHVVGDSGPAARHLEIAPTAVGGESAWPAGCHRQRPLMQICSRVGVAWRWAFSRSQTGAGPVRERSVVGRCGNRRPAGGHQANDTGKTAAYARCCEPLHERILCRGVTSS